MLDSRVFRLKSPRISRIELGKLSFSFLWFIPVSHRITSYAIWSSSFFLGLRYLGTCLATEILSPFSPARSLLSLCYCFHEDLSKRPQVISSWHCNQDFWGHINFKSGLPIFAFFWHFKRWCLKSKRWHHLTLFCHVPVVC